MTGYQSKKAAAQDKLAQPEREALKLALEALDIVKIHFTQNRHVNEAITAIKQALAAPVQEPVAWAVYDKRGGSKSLHWPEQHSPDGDANMFDAVPLYTTPPQEQNFCPRCGKRTQDIHTCTPPQENT
jgi:hypothetical protein